LSADIHALKQATKAFAKGGYTAAQRLQSVRARMSNSAFDMMMDLEELKDQSRLSVAFQRFLDTSNFYYQPKV
jgi:hypothetical protein